MDATEKKKRVGRKSEEQGKVAKERTLRTFHAPIDHFLLDGDLLDGMRKLHGVRAHLQEEGDFAPLARQLERQRIARVLLTKPMMSLISVISRFNYRGPVQAVMREANSGGGEFGLRPREDQQ